MRGANDEQRSSRSRDGHDASPMIIQPAPAIAAVDPLVDIERLLAAGEHRSAWASMVRVLGLHPSIAACQAIGGLAADLDPRQADLVELRVALLGNVTLDLLAAVHIARGLGSRLLIRPFVAEFDTWAQELLDPNGGLEAFEPQVVVLALRLESLAPGLTTHFLERDAAALAQEIEITVERIGAALRALRHRSKAKVLLHSFPLPVERSLGMIDGAHPLGQTAALRTLNERLVLLAAELRDVHVVEMDLPIARVGWNRWYDARMYAMAKLPYTPAALHAITEAHLRYLRAFAGLVRKVLVLDLDNTLWGGIVGEDGVDGIQLGGAYPGNAYQDLQQVILQLHRRGVVLAINSHNNESDVAEVLGRHGGMVLQPEHFAATRINWQDKATNMLELADELGLGVESFVFLEDSDAQCERIRQALPEVLVLQQDGEVAARAGLLAGLGVFDSLGFSDEDRARGAFYRTEAQRAQVKRSAQTLEEYLRSLEMRLVIEPVSPQNLGRIADLTQRTNQFNLTTPRHSRDSLVEFLEHPGREGYGFRLADRFGDYGTIGVTLLEQDVDTTVIDALLMSCRVLKRSVEDAILAFVVNRALGKGAARLRGLYRPSRKNGQVAGFYGARGFEETARLSDGTVVFERASLHPVEVPDWIRISGPD
jgi:FkbH-like protein